MIKFKLFCKDKKKFVCCYQEGIRFTPDTGQIYVNGTNFTDSYITCQFTGLKDKNGVEIYEGDITINEKGRICQIEWFEPMACWDAKFIKETSPKFNGMKSEGYRPSQWSGYIEVIGNVHEQPELLTS